MELLSLLSKHTSNNFDSLMKYDFHFVLGMFHSLKGMFEKEAEEQRKQEESASSSFSMPSFPNMPSF